MSNPSRKLRFAAYVCAFLIESLLQAPRAVSAAQNLLSNGDLAIGSGAASVNGWRTEAWLQSNETTAYSWIRPVNGQPGELAVFSHHDNDARWQQPLSLGPGWYYISAEAQTRGVLSFHTGATISILDGGVGSADLRGDTDWHRLGFYLKVGAKGADIDVCLRLGGYSSLNRGQAFFRRPAVVQVAAPPNAAPYTFDLSEIRKAQIVEPTGQLWSLIVTFVILAIAALVGWLMMAEPAASETAAAAVSGFGTERSSTAASIAGKRGKKRARAR
jgi:hypothetical protein